MTGAESTAVLLLRVVLGVTMIVHGLNHWRGGGRIAGTARWFTGLGLRHGRLQAWLSVVTEMGAGALLVLGLLTPLAGAAVMSVMLVAGLLAHRRNGFFVFKDGYEYVLVLAVACVALAMLGPGDVSLDAAAGIDIDGWAGGGLAAGVGVAGTAGLLAAFWRPGAKLPEATAGEAADGPLGEAPNGPRAKTPHVIPAETPDTPPARTPDATRAETPQESPDEGQEPS
ncbi:DoxX family membrane protein [Streptomyces sp. NPDC088921]|uniref:DoxX family membrane protein n=1 Tax=unclassified Streptomyces TaxID=2593676 RepID=UPI003430649F